MNFKDAIYFMVIAQTAVAVIRVPEYNKPRSRTVYDYIVVGGGTAGSVVANRLSEDEDKTVLLLEAGGAPPVISEIPLCYVFLSSTEIDWTVPTEPQVNSCQAYPEKRCWHSRAKTLGGCSTHNDMAYVRSHVKDYDQWERSGAKGWGWKDVLPLFKKSENMTDPDLAKKDYYGKNGYLTLSKLRYKTEINAALLRGAEELGYHIGDYNDGNFSGFSYITVTQRDGLRCSTEKAYLRPGLDRPNLDIVTHAHVLKINFDGSRAVGVLYDHRNNTVAVEAREEIVVSAGTVGTAQLLLLSGIGPKEELQEFEIKSVSDVPVGRNLQDHVLVPLLFEMNDSVSLMLSRDVTQESLLEFEDGQGPLTSPGGIEIIGSVNSKYNTEDTDWPDVEFTTAPPDNTNQRKDSVGLLIYLQRPRSRGYVKLRSKNPFDNPIIDLNHFAIEDDFQRIIDGVKIAVRLFHTEEVQRYGASLRYDKYRACETVDLGRDQSLECIAHKYSFGGYHLVGTSKMGAPSDPTTVVDPQLRVKGVTGLRVADASIMPFIVSGNPMATCVMIGEKMADIIRNTPVD